MTPARHHTLTDPAIQHRPTSSAVSACLLSQVAHDGSSILESHRFSFDKCFAPSIGQEAVFAEVQHHSPPSTHPPYHSAPPTLTTTLLPITLPYLHYSPPTLPTLPPSLPSLHFSPPLLLPSLSPFPTLISTLLPRLSHDSHPCPTHATFPNELPPSLSCLPALGAPYMSPSLTSSLPPSPACLAYRWRTWCSRRWTATTSASSPTGRRARARHTPCKASGKVRTRPPSPYVERC